MSRVASVILGLALALPQPASAAPPRERKPGDGMVAAGVGVLCGGIAAYALLAAGLGVGSRAEDDIAALQQEEDIARRRDVMERGVLGNRLAIAGGVLAAVAMSVGIPLVVIGRRRHEAAVALQPGGIAVRVRF